MAKLKPCPHCGYDRVGYSPGDGSSCWPCCNWRAWCSACGACSGWRETREQAAEAWNARAVNLEMTIDRVVEMRCALVNKKELGYWSAAESDEFDFLTQSMRTLLEFVRVKLASR